MAQLATVADFRSWAGAAVVTVPDDLVQMCLDEAEAQIIADLGVAVREIQLVPEAASVAIGEELRRAQRLLARRNSPEGVAGIGTEGLVTIPVRDPDSSRAVMAIASLLGVLPGVA